MKDRWGRAESQPWPGDNSVWVLGSLFISISVACALLWLQYQTWTPLQRYWLPTYLSADIAPRLGVSVSTYRLMLVLHSDGAMYPPDGQSVKPGLTRTLDGRRIPFVLTEEATRQGRKLILTPPRPWKNKLIYDALRNRVYEGQALADLVRVPLLCGLGSLILGLMIGIPKDKENTRVRKQGRRLRGPEEVTAAQFNRPNKAA